jgi:hypothetical protein
MDAQILQGVNAARGAEYDKPFIQHLYSRRGFAQPR